MIRKASIMYLKDGCAGEYQKRHDALWPEMKAELKAHGASEYSIFLDPQTNTLFAYVLIESEEKWAAMAETDACRRWWAYMKDIMPTNADNSPVSRDLDEVFYLK